MRKFIALALLGLLPALTRQAAAEVVYRSGEGWTSQSPGDEDAAHEKSAAEQMNTAQGYEKSGDIKKALNAYTYLLKKWPNAASAPAAQLGVGSLSEKTGDFDRAFKAYGQYITKYPRGEGFDRCVEAQFRIARLFLEGQKHRVFGVVPMTATPLHAQEMFEQIIKNAPYSKYAPLAQFSLGRALEKQDKDLEAIAAYQAVITKYPNESVAADAQYQIGYIYFQQSRGNGDPGTSAKARDAFEDFIAKYPDSEKTAQAKDDLKSIGGRQTKGALDIAKFYDKQKKYKAANVYYNDVIKQQPASTDADYAKKRIEAIKNIVGDDSLATGPQRAETGKRASERRKLQAKVETAARPDFAGPPVVIPDEIAPDKAPRLRSTPGEIGPVPAVEPPLPKQ